MSKTLVIGATSAIAQEFARLSVKKGDALFLVGRNAAKLQTVKDDLQVRGGKDIGILVQDANDFEQHQTLVTTAVNRLGGLDCVLIAHGQLGDQERAEKDYRLAEQEFKTNCLSVMSMLTVLALYFEKQKHGTIAVISSVAGDRGRQSNYIYGSAKGAVSIYLGGLRNRLFAAGVSVLTIKPGFVDTPMTAHLKKGLLFSSPATVAAGIYRAVERRRNVVYLPGFWFWIMMIIRLIPEQIFKRLKL
jgi:decaprenylphospho-beta-D-erythro-pentofuranosid-2-ulose 2-reductase